MDIFWNMFEKSGSIEAYLGFKEFEKIENRDYKIVDWQLKKNNMAKISNF